MVEKGMNITRNCPGEKLSKQPLVLVLIQIRFSPVMNLESYIPQIQAALRMAGYPLVEENDNLSVTVTPDGVKPVHTKQWRFKSGDEYSNVILDGGQLSFQTSEYVCFEQFYKLFDSVCVCVFENIAGFIQANVIQRLGLRYVDRIIPAVSDDTVDSYIADGFKISQAPVFGSQPKICTVSQAGEVQIDGNKNGVLVVRITQGEKGLFLPPDLMAKPPKMKTVVPEGRLIGIIDTDHSYLPPLLLKYDTAELKQLFYRMHDNVEAVFHSVVSGEGRKRWQ
jgi:uncharacterized protein (TIGR04255 family)